MYIPRHDYNDEELIMIGIHYKEIEKSSITMGVASLEADALMDCSLEYLVEYRNAETKQANKDELIAFARVMVLMNILIDIIGYDDSRIQKHIKEIDEIYK